MREIELDWNALHSAFQMPLPEVRCFLCMKDGQVVKMAPGDPNLAVIQSNKDEYVLIEAIPSRIQYQWVDEFAKTIDNDNLKIRIEAAINGKGAFRRFKDILLTVPDERRRWFEYRDQKMKTRVIEWIREKGIEPTNEPIWLSEDPAEGEITATNESDTLAEDLDALRDFLIDWFDAKDEASIQPLALETLAFKLAKRFCVRLSIEKK